MDEGGYSFIKSVSMMLNKLPACSVGIDLGDWSGNQARGQESKKCMQIVTGLDLMIFLRIVVNCGGLIFLHLRLNEIQVPDALFSLSNLTNSSVIRTV